jgi:hypothetical protein
MKTPLIAAGTCMALAWGVVRADGAPTDTCEVELDTRLSVYMVTVAGEPYRNKRYLTFDDAVKLRDVLVSAGACEKAGAPRDCELKLLAAGDYAVLRDGVNFDPYSRLRTLQQAKKQAHAMERMNLCKVMR